MRSLSCWLELGFKEELYKHTEIPTLLFEVDTMDPRKVSSKVVREKIKTFFTEIM